MTKKEIIQEKAIELLASKPDGVRYMDLVRMIQGEFPDYPHGTITGSTWNMDNQRPDAVVKVSRGLWKHIEFDEAKIEIDELLRTHETPKSNNKIGRAHV